MYLTNLFFSVSRKYLRLIENSFLDKGSVRHHDISFKIHQEDLIEKKTLFY